MGVFVASRSPSADDGEALSAAAAAQELMAGSKQRGAQAQAGKDVVESHRWRRREMGGSVLVSSWSAR